MIKLWTNQTPINSMGTSTQNAFLNSLDCSQPMSSERLYILYANGTCWKLPAGSRPTLCSMPARLLKCQIEYTNHYDKQTSWRCMLHEKNLTIVEILKDHTIG